MKRIVFASAVGAIVIGVAACASFNEQPVSFTQRESAVASCQKVGDVTAKTNVRDVDVTIELAEQARGKGANFVLRPSDGARTGTAYRCEAPRAAAH